MTLVMGPVIGLVAKVSLESAVKAVGVRWSGVPSQAMSRKAAGVGPG